MQQETRSHTQTGPNPPVDRRSAHTLRRMLAKMEAAGLVEFVGAGDERRVRPVRAALTMSRHEGRVRAMEPTAPWADSSTTRLDR